MWKHPVTPVEYHSLLVQHLGHIDRVVGGMARRRQLSAPDTEELTSVVRYKLIDKDFAILKKFQGRSSITTYLTIVVERLCLDFFNEQWGKWRPSAAALKIGRIGIQLEQLIARDGLTFDEAVNTLQINYGISETRENLLGIYVQLPIRTVRRLAGEEALALMAARGGASDPAFELPEEYTPWRSALKPSSRRPSPVSRFATGCSSSSTIWMAFQWPALQEGSRWKRGRCTTTWKTPSAS